MRPAVVAGLTCSIILSGCIGFASPGDPPRALASSPPPNTGVPTPTDDVMVVDFDYYAQFATDGAARDKLGLCDRPMPLEMGRFEGKWHLPRQHNATIMAGHSLLVIDVTVDDAVSDLDLSGRRVGAYYNNELVFWSDVIKESMVLEFALDGDKVDVDGGPRWAFFTKLTDTLTEDDPDACSSGHQSGSVSIRIHAE